MARPARASLAGDVEEETRRVVSAVSAASSRVRRRSWVVAKEGIERGIWDGRGFFVFC